MAGVEATPAGPTNPKGATDDEPPPPSDQPDPDADPSLNQDPDADPNADPNLNPDPDADPDADPDLNQDPDADPDAAADEAVRTALKPKAVKRFNQMLSQRDEALREAREAKAERDTLKAQLDTRTDEPAPIVKQGDPLARVTNEEQLEAHESYWENVRLWCLGNLQGGIPPKELSGGDGQTELPAETVVENLQKAERILKAVPHKRAFLNTFRAERAKVREAAPELFKPGTPDHAAAVEYHRKLLNFDTQAEQDDIIRKLVKLDRIEREEREGVARYTRVELKKPAAGTKAGTTAGAKPAPKPAPVAAARTPVVRAANAKTTRQQAWERLNAPGGEVDVEELMDA